MQIVPLLFKISLILVYVSYCIKTNLLRQNEFSRRIGGSGKKNYENISLVSVLWCGLLPAFQDEPLLTSISYQTLNSGVGTCMAICGLVSQKCKICREVWRENSGLVRWVQCSAKRSLIVGAVETDLCLCGVCGWQESQQRLLVLLTSEEKVGGSRRRVRNSRSSICKRGDVGTWGRMHHRIAHMGRWHEQRREMRTEYCEAEQLEFISKTVELF